MGYGSCCGTMPVRSVSVLIFCVSILVAPACKPRPAFKNVPAAQNTASSRSTATVSPAAKAYALKTQQDKQRQREAEAVGTIQYDEKGIAAMIRCRSCASKIANIADLDESWLPQPELGSGRTGTASSADPREAAQAAKAQLGTDRCVCACFQARTGRWYAWAEAVR